MVAFLLSSFGLSQTFAAHFWNYYASDWVPSEGNVPLTCRFWVSRTSRKGLCRPSIDNLYVLHRPLAVDSVKSANRRLEVAKYLQLDDSLANMDPFAYLRMSAADQDARRQRYFLPHSDEDPAFPTKQNHLLYTPHVHNYTGDVTDIQDIVLEPDFSPTIVQAEVSSAQKKDLTMPSAKPVFVDSPTGSDSESSTPASPKSNNKSSAVPSKAVLDRAADLTVDDAQGQAISFKDLYQVEPGHSRRVMIIFIRHFFCGVSPRGILPPATHTNNASPSELPGIPPYPGIPDPTEFASRRHLHSHHRMWLPHADTFLYRADILSLPHFR